MIITLQNYEWNFYISFKKHIKFYFYRANYRENDETTRHIQTLKCTTHDILVINQTSRTFHKSHQKFPTKTSRKKSEPVVSNTIQKLISRYTWYFSFLHSKNKFTDLSKISPSRFPPNNFIHRRMQQRSHRSSKQRKRGEYSLERIEISSNHFATPTSNTFAVIPISHGWNSPRRSINQPDKRDGFEA